MHAFQWSAIFLLALACSSVSAFVIPAPSSPTGTPAPAVSSRSNDDCAASPTRRMKHQLVRARPVSQRPASGLTVVAASRGNKGSDEGEEVEEKGGIEPKYLAAIALVAFAALYDLFVTHEGRLWEL
ncbi:unnamed protein product [Scytosiphon promiscuus]